MNRLFVKVSASFFGLGYAPLASGTVASLAALPIAWFLPDAPLLILCLAFTAIGFAVAESSREAFHSEDPHKFVLDEVCGMILSVIGLPRIWQVYLAGFLLFRLLDTWKPWPISFLQARKGAWSIMADDLAAGLAVNIILWWMLLFIL